MNENDNNANNKSLHTWLPGPIASNVKQTISRIEKAEDVHQVAIMPDVHLAEGVCVGTVMATNQLIYPQAIGSDIGCGMTAVRFNCNASTVNRKADALEILNELRSAVPIKRQRSLQSTTELASEFTNLQLSDNKLIAASRREGRIELGTLGRGNHFLELQSDENNQLWLMIHSGSRNMGQLVSQFHTKNATKIPGGLLYLDSDSDQGQAFINDVNWTIAYAKLNRLIMVKSVAGTLHKLFRIDPEMDTLIDCNHDHISREQHFGKTLWVHRKGANHAWEGQLGIIPGSMGTCSFHVTGRGCERSLCSSSHGAGRAMPRNLARKKITVKDLTRELKGVWYDETLSRKLCDEAPSAYKDIKAVMRAQKELVQVSRRLKPVICYKGV